MKNDWIELWQPKNTSDEGAWVVYAAEMRAQSGLTILGAVATVELNQTQGDVYDADELEWRVYVPGESFTEQYKDIARERIRKFYESFAGDIANFNMVFIKTGRSADKPEQLEAVCPKDKALKTEARITRADAVKQFGEDKVEGKEFEAWHRYFRDCKFP